MGFEYAEIRRSVYEPAPGLDPVVVRYESLPFPERFASDIVALLNRDNDGKETLRSAPTRRLNELLQALASDVSVMRRGMATSDSRGHDWLYHPLEAPNPLPVPVLHRLFEYWAAGLGTGEEFELAAHQLGERLRAEPPKWSPVDVPLLQNEVSSGGTAAPDSLRYTLIPDHFARRVQRLEPFRHGSQVLRFRAIARGPRQQGAELMSQPLAHEGTDGRVWWFSVLINVTLHTVPFDPLPKIHLHTGIRRWATRPDAKRGLLRLSYRRLTSVYLRPTTPWLPKAPVSERFGVARLGWDREIRRTGWKHGGPAQLLGKLAGCRPFPDVDALLRAPESWLRGENGLEALVVHANSMGGHEVGAGLMSHQRSEILEWAEQALEPELVRVPDLVRSELTSDAPVNVRRSVPKKRRPAAEIEAASRLRRSLGALSAHRSEHGEAVFEARLLWNSHEIRQAVITDLTGLLGLPAVEAQEADDHAHETSSSGHPVILTWRTDELVVRLRCLRLGTGLGGSLGIDPKSRTRRLDQVTAVVRRRQELEAFLAADGAQVDQPGLAVVEIPRRRTFEDNPRDDPKFAIRLGCADAGVVTQFIADRGPQRRHRARAAWLDGLRQIGASTVPMPDVYAGLPSGTQFLAVWLAGTQRDSPAAPRRKLPVAVLVRPDATLGEQVLGWDPEAFDNVGAWTSYPRLLTRLPALARVELTELDDAPHERWIPWSTYRRDLERQKAVVEGFIQKLRRSREVVDHPTVMVVHAQNARQHWTWIQDGVVRRDLMRTGAAPPGGLDPDLRLVRVRTGEQRETGSWWAIGHPDGINGISAGLWTHGKHAPDDPRVFYSTTAKASSAGSAAVSADKLIPRPLRTGERKGELTIDTEVPGWNPALVELAVLGCHQDDGDSPEALAMTLHQLRQAPDHLNALRLPLPLHLARHAQEYVLPMPAPDEERDEDLDQAQETVEIEQTQVVED